MSVLDKLKKPEYYFNPLSILRRQNIKPGNKRERVSTVFGSLINVYRSDSLGLAICKSGVYDLALTEMLYRLIQPGNTVLDIGANIGYITQLMSIRTGINGKVISVEPNPFILETLADNIALLPTSENVVLQKMALSNFEGTAAIEFPAGYEENQGLAKLGDSPADNSVMVDVMSLDNLAKNIAGAYDVVKIDAEGHELKILQGGKGLLSLQKIRHIFYEDFDAYPSGVSSLLEEYGYRIYRIEKGWLGPLLKQPDTAVDIQSWETVNYLATIDNNMVKSAIRGSWYKSLWNK